MIKEHRERFARLDFGEDDLRELRELHWEEILGRCLGEMGKGDITDMSSEQKRRLAKAVEAIKAQCESARFCASFECPDGHGRELGKRSSQAFRSGSSALAGGPEAPQGTDWRLTLLEPPPVAIRKCYRSNSRRVFGRIGVPASSALPDCAELDSPRFRLGGIASFPSHPPHAPMSSDRTNHHILQILEKILHGFSSFSEVYFNIFSLFMKIRHFDIVLFIPFFLLRSPQFRLNGSGDLITWLVGGGSSSPSLAGTNVDDLPSSSVEEGFRGVALRSVTNGTYMLSGTKTFDGDDWEEVVFTAEELAGLPQHHVYTLDLIDAGHGGWGWVNMDSVSIPGRIVDAPIEPETPWLVIERFGETQVRLSWPGSAAGWTLQRSVEAGGGYVDAGLQVTVEGDENVAYDTILSGRQFYRLVE